MTTVFEPEILVLYCGHGLAKGDRLSEGTQKAHGFNVRFVMMPCSSKVETGYLLKLIEAGTDGIVIVACPEEECRFLVGSKRAEGRIGYARVLLGEAGMSRKRLVMVQRKGLSADEIMTSAQKCADAVQPLGENPLKTMCDNPICMMT